MNRSSGSDGRRRRVSWDGQAHRPSRIAEARRQIAEAARRHGKFAGTVASCDTLEATVALGYQFISIGADVVGLSEMFRHIAKAFAEIGS